MRSLTIRTFLVIAILAIISDGMIYAGMSKEPVPGSKGRYYKDSSGVYVFIPRDCSFLPCMGPDLRLKKYKKIPKADPDSFEVVRTGRDARDIVARDKDSVFYGDEWISNGNPMTLEVFASYAKDDQNIYIDGHWIHRLHTESFEHLGGDFVKDKNGIYSIRFLPPTKLDIVDVQSFKLLEEPKELSSMDNLVFPTYSSYETSKVNIIAQDKNLVYVQVSGLGYHVLSSIREEEPFELLGCDYFRYKGKVFHGFSEIVGADSESFKVVEPFPKPEHKLTFCRDKYALDKNHRYIRKKRIDPRSDRGKEHTDKIDWLLLSYKQKKVHTEKITFVCASAPNNWWARRRFSLVSNPSKGDFTPFSVRVIIYPDMSEVETWLWENSGSWQKLPNSRVSIMYKDCGTMSYMKFRRNVNRPWLKRRHPRSHSMVIFEGTVDPILVVVDSKGLVKLAFSKTQIIDWLDRYLYGSGLEPFSERETGWGRGWILGDGVMLNQNSDPEVWLPVQIKGRKGYEKGADYVVIGFMYKNGEFNCISDRECNDWRLPKSERFVYQ